MSPLALVLLGLMLGIRHATDADHVIAVTTIVSRERRILASTAIGLVWGLGHTFTVFAVGAMIIIFKVIVPPRLGLMMEFAVALVLILLGISSVTDLVAALARRFARSARRPDNAVITHSHETNWWVRQYLSAPRDFLIKFAIQRPMLKAFGVGLVHGLAGSAAIALLVLGAIPDSSAALVYLLVFGIGTMIGMTLITTALGAPFVMAAERMRQLHARVVMASGTLSFAFGFFMAYQIAVIDGLFGAVPMWAPH